VSAETRTAQAGVQRFRARYGAVLEWLVVALMVILAAEVTLGVVFRALGRSLAWYDEIASVLLAWLTFYGSALASVKRAHIGCPELVIAFFLLLGGVGAWIMPILATDTLVSLTWMPMSVVQSVIPISAALIVIAEVTHLVDLMASKSPPASATSIALADGLH